jgi:hypothetical protein
VFRARVQLRLAQYQEAGTLSRHHGAPSPIIMGSALSLLFLACSSHPHSINHCVGEDGLINLLSFMEHCCRSHDDWSTFLHGVAKKWRARSWERRRTGKEAYPSTQCKQVSLVARLNRRSRTTNSQSQRNLTLTLTQTIYIYIYIYIYITYLSVHV